MAFTDAMAAVGVTVSFNAVAIGNLIDIDGPGMSTAEIDTTDQASAVNRFRTFIGGLIDPGEVTLTVEFDAETPLVTDITLTTPTNPTYALVIVYPNAAAGLTGTWTCQAFCKARKPTAKLGDKMTAELTFKLSGVPVIS